MTIELMNKRFRPQATTGKEDYQLSCPIDSDWDDKPVRIMLVLETIDGQDLREGRLLFDRSRAVVHNLLNYTLIQYKQQYPEFRRKDCAFSCVNYNSYKFFDTPMETWAGHRRVMARRLDAIIEEKKPTHVIVFGDRAMMTLVPGQEFLEKKRGWTFPYKTQNGHPCKISGNLDLQPLYSTQSEDAKDSEEQSEEGDLFGVANLLYYVSRKLMDSLHGRLRYDLSHIKPNVKYIDTVKKFKAFYRRLIEQEAVAVDTETANGSVNHNAIHTIQFAWAEDRSYFLPFDHPESPFNWKQRQYIKQKLRAYFYAKPKELPLKYLIMQYGTFDLRMLRVELGIPIIFHKVWEIMAGRWCFHPDTLVETEAGPKPIQYLIEKAPHLRVWSQNIETGERELKPLVNRVIRPSDEDLIEITYEGGSIRVTADHKIWSNTRNAYVKAGEIEDGEDLKLLGE